ncbi:MAG: hypothetical protein U1E53_02915 [Dongiaceae bacterium]
MSDIRLDFGWEAIAVLVLLLGWPGLIGGAALGALAWRRRPWLGGLLGGLGGTAAVAGLRVLWM